MKVATNSEVRIIRPYHIQAGKRRHPAVKIVFRVQNGFLPDYWGLQIDLDAGPAHSGGGNWPIYQRRARISHLL